MNRINIILQSLIEMILRIPKKPTKFQKNLLENCYNIIFQPTYKLSSIFSYVSSLIIQVTWFLLSLCFPEYTNSFKSRMVELASKTKFLLANTTKKDWAPSLRFSW